MPLLTSCDMPSGVSVDGPMVQTIFVIVPVFGLVFRRMTSGIRLFASLANPRVLVTLPAAGRRRPQAALDANDDASGAHLLVEIEVNMA